VRRGSRDVIDGGVSAVDAAVRHHGWLVGEYRIDDRLGWRADDRNILRVTPWATSPRCAWRLALFNDTHSQAAAYHSMLDRGYNIAHVTMLAMEQVRSGLGAGLSGDRRTGRARSRSR